MNRLLLCGVVLLAGCGVRPITGGTPGVVRAQDGGLADVQVTIYQADGSAWQNLGFADTAADGTFALVTPGARGPLLLSPGDYRVTLESVGAPVAIPAACKRVDTTPLAITWSHGDREIVLEVPVSLMRR